MVNKKGWVRVVEATICTLLILGVVISVYRYHDDNGRAVAKDEMRIILDEVAKNRSLRSSILNSSFVNQETIEKKVFDFVSGKIEARNLNFTVKICDLSELEMSCQNKKITNQKDIFSEIRIISADVNSSDFSFQKTPRKVKIYLWER